MASLIVLYAMPLKVTEDDDLFHINLPRAKRNIDAWDNSMGFWSVPDFGFPVVKARAKRMDTWGNEMGTYSIKDFGFPFFNQYWQTRPQK